MKTGMELVKEIRELARDRLLLSQQVADARARGLFEAADLLQAWLREAENWVERNEYHDGTWGGRLMKDRVLKELLGTTQEGKG